MAMSTITSTPAMMPSPFGSPPVHRITVDEYERIIRAGALEDPGKVELIDGYLVDKMGKNPEHSYVSGQQIPVTIDGHQLHPIAVDDILP
jgi:hypothetical protein